MQKCKLIVYLVAVLTACGGGFPSTTYVRQNTPQHELELRVQNYNWSTAKVYLVPESSLRSSGTRAITVGFGRSESVNVTSYAVFRLRIAFVGSNKVWYSGTWTTGRPCLRLVIEVHLPATYVVPCR